MNRAIDICHELRATLTDYAVSSDIDWEANARVTFSGPGWTYGRFLLRPLELAQDDTAMIAVVQHALGQIHGEPDDIIVLLQPTQPFRTPAHVTTAIQQLRETQADSVVSVVPLPLTHHAAWQCAIEHGQLVHPQQDGSVRRLGDRVVAERRQDLGPRYIRDGTVYAFWRRTVTTYGTIYGEDVRPLLIAPEDSCELDTEADWDAVTRRWHATLRLSHERRTR